VVVHVEEELAVALDSEVRYCPWDGPQEVDERADVAEVRPLELLPVVFDHEPGGGEMLGQRPRRPVLYVDTRKVVLERDLTGSAFPDATHLGEQATTWSQDPEDLS